MDHIERPMKQPHRDFKLRIPLEVHRHLMDASRKQKRSMGSHIVFLLQQEMEKEKAPEPRLGNRSDASDSE